MILGFLMLARVLGADGGDRAIGGKEPLHAVQVSGAAVTLDEAECSAE